MSGLEHLLAVARFELGTAENPPGSNHVKYADWYGFSGPWCGMFVSWCVHISGNDDLVPRYAYTPAGADWFARRGQWTRTPARGDIAFYDTAGQGRISHTGIVESVLTDGSWYAIEGNTNGAGGRTGGEVRRQHRTTTGTFRGGFGRPRWTTQPAPNGRPTLRLGSAGDDVRALQNALNRYLSGRQRPLIAVDGQFGPATRTALVSYQASRGLADDGICGPLSWAALGS